MGFYRRRLPHLWYPGVPVFVTWRLKDSLPPGRVFAAPRASAGEAFAAMDKLLDERRVGARYLGRPEVAEVVCAALRFNRDELRHYSLHAYVVMPNHVHILVTPEVQLAALTHSLKSITARRCNEVLLRTGPFWEGESYDHLVRNPEEFRRIVRYVEWNPVRAGLARSPEAYRWSSAAGL